MFLRNTSQMVVRDHGDAAKRESHDVVIIFGQEKTVKVDEVAGNVYRGDLALATFHLFAARSPTVHKQTAVRRVITFCYEILTRCENSPQETLRALKDFYA